MGPIDEIIKYIMIEKCNLYVHVDHSVLHNEIGFNNKTYVHIHFFTLHVTPQLHCQT
jgi:hypothetical protein